jgi:hypothetical protein
MIPESIQVQQVISRSNAILADSLRMELFRALICCSIANQKETGTEKLPYLIVAEQTSAKFVKLYAQKKMVRSRSVLRLMILLERALGGNADILSSNLAR